MNEIAESCPVLAAIIPLGELTTTEYRAWIAEAERRMMNLDCSVDRHTENSPLPLKHVFTPGLYTREIFMPKGFLVISRIHMFEHPFIISKGTVFVYDGKTVEKLTGPCMRVTPAGTKRILYVEEDTIWTTFHVTDKCTFDEVDKNGVITCDTFEEFERFTNKEISI